MDHEKRRLLITVLFLIPIILIGDIVSGAIGLASGPVLATNVCSTSNGYCNPIQHVGSAVFNASSVQQSLSSSPSLSLVQNDTMIVSAQADTAGHVSSVTDTLGNSFSQILNVTDTIESQFEIWTTQATSSGSDTITINWNQTSNNIAGVDTYRGVSKLQNIVSNDTGRVGQTLNAITLSDTTTVSGSWLYGVSSSFIGVTNHCTNGLTPSTGWITRIDSCSNPQVNGNEVILTVDNATNLLNSVTLKLTATLAAGWQDFMNIAMLQLTPTDSEPAVPVGICFATSADTCHLNSVSKATGPTANTQLLHAGTTYCTGVTTGPLSFTGSRTLQIIATYTIQDNNVTGQVIQLKLILSGSAPQTTFGNPCSTTGNTQIFNMYFPITGTALTFTFMYTIFPATSPRYESMSITPLTTNVSVNSLGASSFLVLQENS